MEVLILERLDLLKAQLLAMKRRKEDISGQLSLIKQIRETSSLQDKAKLRVDEAKLRVEILAIQARATRITLATLLTTNRSIA